jgi:hypothetical protein
MFHVGKNTTRYAITENEMGRPEKMTALLAHIEQVKIDYPKP